MKRAVFSLLSAVGVLGCASAVALAATAQAESRGELLYSTHCISCHTTEMHWRDARVATDWNSLKTQVKRWQGVVSLDWNDADIVAVSRHLNDTIYHFPQTTDSVTSMGPPAHSSVQTAH